MFFLNEALTASAQISGINTANSTSEPWEAAGFANPVEVAI